MKKLILILLVLMITSCSVVDSTNDLVKVYKIELYNQSNSGIITYRIYLRTRSKDILGGKSKSSFTFLTRSEDYKVGQVIEFTIREYQE